MTSQHKFGDNSGQSEALAHYVPQAEEKVATPGPRESWAHPAPIDVLMSQARAGPAITSSRRASAGKDRADNMFSERQLELQTISTPASGSWKPRDATHEVAPGERHPELQAGAEPFVPEGQVSEDNAGYTDLSVQGEAEHQNEKNVPKRDIHTVQVPTAQVGHGSAQVHVPSKTY